MTRVAAQGPWDIQVWRSMVQRTDAIAQSLSPKQAALILSALAKVRHRDESFLRRFTLRFAPALVSRAELLDLCGIVSSLSLLGTYSKELYTCMAQQLLVMTSRMDARQISLVANAYAKVRHADPELMERLLAQVPRRAKQFDARDASILLNAFAQLDSGRPGDGILGRGCGSDATAQHFEALLLRLPNLLPDASLQSLTLIVNALAQLRLGQKDVLDLLVEELVSDTRRLDRLTPRQLAMVFNAAGRLQIFEPRLLDALTSRVRAGARGLDPQSLCVVANAGAKLRLGVETFAALSEQVPRHVSRLSGRHVAMLCHAWARAHVHSDDLFSLLALRLAQLAGDLSAREVAMCAYGYAHFRKAPSDLFEMLLSRFAALWRDGQVGEGELLMMANALGRVGWGDPVVAGALREYMVGEPGLANVTPQTRIVFGLPEFTPVWRPVSDEGGV